MKAKIKRDELNRVVSVSSERTSRAGQTTTSQTIKMIEYVGNTLVPLKIVIDDQLYLERTSDGYIEVRVLSDGSLDRQNVRRVAVSQRRGAVYWVEYQALHAHNHAHQEPVERLTEISPEHDALDAKNEARNLALAMFLIAVPGLNLILGWIGLLILLEMALSSSVRSIRRKRRRLVDVIWEYVVFPRSVRKGACS